MSALTPAQLLADNLVLTAGQVATVLGLVHRRGVKAGQPDRHLAPESTPTSRMLAERAAQGLPAVPTPDPETIARLRRFIDAAQARATTTTKESA